MILRTGKVWIVAALIGQGCVLAIEAQVPNRKPDVASGVISGHVRAASGELPANTIVYVSTVGLVAPPESMVVKGDGTFKIEGLQIGIYRVSANAPGFVSDSLSAIRKFYHTGDSVDLTLRKGGVITGTVVSANNTPVVSANIRAYRILDEDGKPISATNSFSDRFTDDRGVYRLYGLLPGTYIVSAGGMSGYFGGYGEMAYGQDTPTFAPSSTRETASQVVVQSGEEVTADIQYRGEPGHTISGTILGTLQAQAGMSFGASITIIDVRTGTALATNSTSSFNNFGFAVYGIPDGEYELIAQQSSQSRDMRMSEPKRVTVKGTDVSGLSVTLGSLPSVTGRVIIDRQAAADCVERPATAFQETLVTARREKKPVSAKRDASDQTSSMFANQIADAVPDAKGEFVLRNLHAGTYRLNFQLPSAGWYLRNVALGANSSNANIISDGITLKSQTVSGVIVTISEGAAGIRGRVFTLEGQQLPSGMIVYLVPADKENANNLLRFFEARTASDGRFTIRNVPPGDYFIMPRTTNGDQPAGNLIREDGALRGTVMHEAENAKQKLTLKPCERIDDYELSYSPATKP